MPFDGKSLEANSPVITLLREARGRIERGFVQHRLMNTATNPPQYCALGAVIDSHSWLCIEISQAEEKAFQYLQKALGLQVQDGLLSTMGIAEFNNTHTQQEVLNIFDKAIELAVADALVTA